MKRLIRLSHFLSKIADAAIITEVDKPLQEDLNHSILNARRFIKMDGFEIVFRFVVYVKHEKEDDFILNDARVFRINDRIIKNDYAIYYSELFDEAVTEKDLIPYIFKIHAVEYIASYELGYDIERYKPIENMYKI